MDERTSESTKKNIKPFTKVDPKHYQIFDVSEECQMVKFAKENVPGFHPDDGYGFTELESPEYIEPWSTVMFLTKV